MGWGAGGRGAGGAIDIPLVTIMRLITCALTKYERDGLSTWIVLAHVFLLICVHELAWEGDTKTLTTPHPKTIIEMTPLLMEILTYVGITLSDIVVCAC